jgi:hypothetical protein
MPVYCYTNDAHNQTIERVFSMKDDIPREIVHNGVVFRRDLLAEHRGTFHRPGLWPMISPNLGWPAGYMPTVRERLEKAGCQTDFTKTNDPILRDRHHRAEYMKVFGLYDRDAGYSDPNTTRRNEDGD